MEEKRTRKVNRTKAELRDALLEKINHHKELLEKYEGQLEELDQSIEREYKELMEVMSASGRGRPEISETQDGNSMSA